MTERQRANLRKGGAPANAESAARARAGKAAIKAEENRIAETASDDPWEAMAELQGLMAQRMVQILREEQRTRARPSREATDRLRELRQTTQTLVEYRRLHRSVIDDASVFFEEFDRRMAEQYGPEYDEIFAVAPIADVPDTD